jgi:hypothetical protein
MGVVVNFNPTNSVKTAMNTPIECSYPDTHTIATDGTTSTPAPAPNPIHEAETGNPPENFRFGNGKVARLSRKIRDRLSEMLIDNVPFKQILANLGEDAKELNEDHISEWKKYGYQRWLIEWQRSQDLVGIREAAIDLVEKKAGATVQDASRTIASAQLYELLLSFDPRGFSNALQQKPELYLRLINTLSRLCESETAHSRLRTQGSLLEDHVNSANHTADGNVIISAEKLNHLLRIIKLL